MTDNKTEKNTARRRLLKSVVAGGGVLATGKLLPENWARPVVRSVILPAHAQTSPSIVTGDFGAATDIAFNDHAPSILDLFVQRAHAAPATQVGNVFFEAHWTVRENDAAICGGAQFGNSSVLLNGNVGRSGDSLGDFSQAVGTATLEFSNQQVSDSGVNLTASARGDSGSFVAPPGGPGCGGDTSATKDSSSPYADDEEIV